VTLYTRSGLDWTARFPAIAADIARLPAGKLVLDGEVISADAKGHPSFSALQDDLKRRHYDRMVYYAFDLLHLDGFETRAAPLLKRKRVLQSVLSEAASASPLVIYSGHFEDGADLYARSRGLSLEGVISKRTDAPYSGRSEDWIKVKCWKRNRYVVVRFVPGAGGISALRLARREGRELLYAGKVGTGFDRKLAAEVRRQLEPLAVKRSPIDHADQEAGHDLGSGVEHLSNLREWRPARRPSRRPRRYALFPSPCLFFLPPASSCRLSPCPRCL
jgi:bifunctional non-homologous end joining protein LigD